MVNQKELKQTIKTVGIIVGLAIFVHVISKIIPMAILHYLGKS